MKHIGYVILLCSLIALISCSDNENSIEKTEQIYEKRTQKPFQDVIQDSEFAITEQNFRITNRLHIGKAIKERGSTGFPQNEVILFCNLEIAKDMLKIEPRYINYCPYKLTISEFDGGITVGTRLLPSLTDNPEMDKISKYINTILISMVEYAASEDPFILEQD